MRAKYPVLLCVLVLFCLSLTSCSAKGKGAPLRICFDVGNGNDQYNGSSQTEQAVKAFLIDYDVFTQKYGWARSQDFEIEIIPSASKFSTERAATLQRIRTEIMTGGGPDVFVLNCQGSCVGGELDYSERLESSRLFPYPEKAINGDVFLPLDEYIESAEMVDWSTQQPQVLDGGRNQKGELVAVPMSFTVPVNVYREKDLPGGVPKGGTWAQVMAGEDSALAPQALWLWEHMFAGPPNLRVHTSGLACLFPRLADFEAGRVCFTEEELLEIIQEDLEACRRLHQPGKNQLENYAAFADPETLLDSNMGAIFGVALRQGEPENAAYVPLANLEGGVTAEVTRYCAVNRNTSRPLDAFHVVECLMDAAFQNNSTIERMGTWTDGKMPVDMKVFSREFPMLYGMSIPPQHFEQWRRVCESITDLHFPSPLESQLEDMMYEIQTVLVDSLEPEPDAFRSPRQLDFYKGEISHKQLKEIVHRYYKRICRLVDEA